MNNIYAFNSHSHIFQTKAEFYEHATITFIEPAADVKNFWQENTGYTK